MRPTSVTSKVETLQLNSIKTSIYSVTFKENQHIRKFRMHGNAFGYRCGLG